MSAKDNTRKKPVDLLALLDEAALFCSEARLLSDAILEALEEGPRDRAMVLAYTAIDRLKAAHEALRAYATAVYRNRK